MIKIKISGKNFVKKGRKTKGEKTVKKAQR